jgi:SAM-dependent methyltransferase
MMKNYVDINAKTIDKWIDEGWEWGTPISHQTYIDALKGKWEVVLTPHKAVPKSWFPSFKGLKILGLASGGGQQMPIFAALGAKVTIIDISDKQLAAELMVSQRESYDIDIVKGDITKRFPFEDQAFDLIFHPVSNVYIENVDHVFREAYRVLKHGGYLLSGLDNGVNFMVDDDETTIIHQFPFNPLKNKEQLAFLEKDDSGIQFSHTLEEQIGDQLKAGFMIEDLYEDLNSEGKLFELNIPTYFATKAIKK